MHGILTTIADIDLCKKKYNQTETIDEKNICTTTHKYNGSGLCDGDNAAALVTATSEKSILLGISEMPSERCVKSNDSYDVHVNIAHHLDWIISIAGIANLKDCGYKISESSTRPPPPTTTKNVSTMKSVATTIKGSSGKPSEKYSG